MADHTAAEKRPQRWLIDDPNVSSKVFAAIAGVGAKATQVAIDPEQGPEKLCEDLGKILKDSPTASVFISYPAEGCVRPDTLKQLYDIMAEGQFNAQGEKISAADSTLFLLTANCPDQQKSEIPADITSRCQTLKF